MRFYRATAFLFPRHYERRVLLVCLAVVHVPLAACLLFETVTGEWQRLPLLVLLGATILGTVLGLGAIHALLAPIVRATDLLEAIQKGERLVAVPRGSDDLAGRLLLGLGIAANESAARVERLIDAAERDPLTGIRNRRGLLEAAERLLLGESNAVLALIDLDHFKLINDQFGHDAGDDLLKGIARRLQNDLRRSDVVARWGGEEFAVLLPDTTLEEARAVLERLRASVALDGTLGVQDWLVTFSCGLAPVRTFAQLGEATRRADAALYAAKEKGRNRISVTSE